MNDECVTQRCGMSRPSRKTDPPTWGPSGRLTRNTLWSLLGQGIPLLVAIFTVPPLIHGLGAERYGVLNLAWMLIGYFGLFDLGLSRALIKLVAETLGTDEDRNLPAQVWTALFMMFGMATVGGLAMWQAGPWLVHDILKIPPALQPETLRAVSLLALALPILVTDAGISGVLAAHQEFGKINAVVIPLRIFMFVGPLATLAFSHNLVTVTGVLIAGRLVAWGANWFLCLRVMPSLRRRVTVARQAVGPLLRFGGWMTVSNVISPIMVSLDQFLIGAMISAAAVTYYATPYALATKLWILPGGLVSVLFPAFSSLLAQDRQRAAHVFARGTKCLFLCLFPISLLLLTLAHPLLKLWLGDEFARHSARVLQWLVVGVFVNSLAHIPFALVQGAGKADLTAKLHLTEFPVYLLGLWWLLKAYGIEGAAIAWTARVSVDAAVLFGVAGRLLPESTPKMRPLLPAVAVALALFAAAFASLNVWWQIGFFLISATVAAPATWFGLFAPDERAALRIRLNELTSILKPRS